MGNETETDILDGLSDRVEEKDFGGDGASGSDHGNRVNNRDSIEEGLDENIPNGGDVAVFNVDRTEKKGDAERKKI